jgi:hypothetical protein
MPSDSEAIKRVPSEVIGSPPDADRVLLRRNETSHICEKYA